MRIKFIIAILIISLMAACGSSSSSGGDSGGGSITITGTVTTGSSQQSSISRQEGLFAHVIGFFAKIAKAFSSSGLSGAHVNVCTIQDNTLQPLSGQATVLADSNGAFTISIDYSDIPTSRQLFVCAAPPSSSDDYTVLAPIPQDLLPTDSTEVTTVSVNPNVNTTIITRYACGQNIMLFNASKCLKMDQAQMQVLNDSLDNYFNNNPGTTPDLANLSDLLGAIANDDAPKTIFESWLSEVPDTTYNDFISGAQNFTKPTIPAPSGGDTGSGSVSIGAFSCTRTTNRDQSIHIAISAEGSGGGGNMNVVTIFFSKDGSDLFEPSVLTCQGWSQTGGLGTCSKATSSTETVTWVGTYIYDTYTAPTSIKVEVKGYESGSSTVLDSAEQTVTCS
ncbi:MAG: hypothetical protein ABIE74_02465 [Pseudomonadota bacterium]